MYFASVDEVSNALEHYLLRPSKSTGRSLSASAIRTARLYITDEVKQLICSGLRDGELMRAIDASMSDKSKTHRSLGIVVVAQFARYYELLEEELYLWWVREGNRRYKPNKTVAERIIPKDKLKAYFDGFLSDDPSHFTQARLYLFSALLLLSGARMKAIAELDYEDITIANDVFSMSIRRLKSHSISRQIINIPMDVKLPNGRPFGEAVYRYYALRPNSPALFVDDKGVRSVALDQSMRHQMTAQAKRLGVGHFTPHMFRFTCASILSDYVGIRQAQQLLGHHDMRTTLRYAGQAYDNVSQTTISNGFAALTESINKGE